MLYGVLCIHMRIRRGEFERIVSVLSDAEPDEPLTAREILDLLEEHGQGSDFDSPHRVATVLGRRAQAGDVEVIQGQPYRYRVAALQ
jgi:predicted Zn-ribbon and HTH transcriptional regulator